MGDVADAVLEGVLCQCCGEYIDADGPGHPRTCADCVRYDVPGDDDPWPDDE